MNLKLLPLPAVFHPRAPARKQPRPPSLFPFLSLGCSDDDNRDDSAAASCSSRGEPGLTLDQPHPSPSGSLPAAPQGEEVPDTGNESSNRSPPHATPTGETQTTDHDVSCNYPLVPTPSGHYYPTTLALATKWGSQTQFETTRARKVKRHFDELSEYSRLTDAESNFRVTVFNACLDIIIQQLSQRFTSLNATVNMFEAIHPNTLLQAKDEDLHEAAQRLREHYSRDIAASCFLSEPVSGTKYKN
ncbi:hypothetical protein KUCAC02_001022 [Chaenocephalus aceratus]|uniref:Uncharacterized protein n=1 Tax=Chaenocephalus aceratus TaxID=36190 RepID=A0ACB9XV45_CHAAC|nr:hypothetical protein KUCAC02_001022 [Chaenocephalus aceratus]